MTILNPSDLHLKLHLKNKTAKEKTFHLQKSQHFRFCDIFIASVSNRPHDYSFWANPPRPCFNLKLSYCQKSQKKHFMGTKKAWSVFLKTADSMPFTASLFLSSVFSLVTLKPHFSFFLLFLLSLLPLFLLPLGAYKECHLLSHLFHHLPSPLFSAFFFFPLCNLLPPALPLSL